ncbi:MAG: polyphosphate polymerase domain-containing protein [Clostridiaceae bacterium]|nr:polyphosphate polymerase domain-containing protein [Eubacteriales bacterium]
MEPRHEIKLAINEEDRVILRQGLSAVMTRDANAGAGGRYKVRSLYFDNFDDKALREKLEGVDGREKFRLRCYNDDPSLILLEKKSKTRGLCKKYQSRLTEEEVRRLLNGDTAFLLAGDALQRELYAKLKTEQLRPRAIVDYMREPFVCTAGNVRVTIDSDIRTGLYSRSFFDAALPTVQAGDTKHLLEVKFDAFLPDVILNVLQIGSRRAAAFSKYAASRMFG